MNAERIAGFAALAGLLAFIAGFDPVAMLVITILLAGAWASLANSRTDADDCDGHAQARMDDDGAPTERGQCPFGKKED